MSTAATMLESCASGLALVMTPTSLLFLCAGVMVGGLVGILPGLGGAATIALLLPFVFDQAPHQAFALLVGLISVTATTGDLTSILLGVPGEATAAATVVDGHPMARRGEAGRAIGASLASSLAGAIFGALTLGIGIVVARPLSRALGSPELFMLAIVGVCLAVPLTSAARLKGLAAGGLGFTLATVGLDPFGAVPRFTFGQLVLWDGIGLIPAALGLYAIPEIISLAGRTSVAPLSAAPVHARFVDGVRDVMRLWRVVLRSSAIGTGVGLLPGLGGSVSQWIAYASAAKRSTNPREFGGGAIEGVIAPSAANNATLGGALVPTLALGIPGSLSTAMLLTALIVKGFVPGPQMLVPEREGGHLAFVFALAWMIVAANLLATAASWSASGLLIRITRVRSAVLVPILLLLVFVGAFTERHLIADLVITLIIGAAGLAFAHFGWPRAPVLIGLVLGRLAENRLFLSIDAYGALWLLRPGVLLGFAIIAASWAYPYLNRARAHTDVEVANEPVHRASGGEHALIVVLLAASLAAIVGTVAFASRSALFPRLALGAMVMSMAAVLARDVRRAREAAAATTTRDRLPLQAVGFVPLFVLLIWALGFTLGAPAAVLMYLVLGRRERMGTVLGVTLAASLLIEVVMVRLFQIPFPTGAVLAWAGVSSR